LAIGSFDGVHSGHQHLIRMLVEGARRNEAKAVVLTFHPHPAVILRGKKEPFYLTSLEEKLDLLESFGVDYCVAMEFNLTVAFYTAQYFIQYLFQHMKIEKIVVGKGFALGRGRTGDINTLTRIGTEMGFSLDVIDPLENDGMIMSSSYIRKMISDGAVDTAAKYLARKYSINGIVTHGDGRGTTIGFPTANIVIPPLRLLPKPGVYACYTILKNKSYLSVANIGFRPTFIMDDPNLHLEVHILDYNSDLYGEMVKVEFVKYLRDEVKFNSVDNLVDQIKSDIQRAREFI
jgi:riboflavin kinase/FMN adenylyltransferase